MKRRSLSDIAFLALVAVLPVHTVYFRGVVAWKPWLVLLLVVSAIDLASGARWPRRAVLGGSVFLAAVLISWPGVEAGATFWRLWLALAAGVLLMFVVGRRAADVDQVLRVVFWSSAVMGATAVVLGLVTNGVFGEWAVSAVNGIPGIDRVNKPAYLGEGFVALTNWHQDPGYAALWANLWLVLSVYAWTRGVVNGPKWLGGAVLGGLITLTVLTFSRTGWVGLIGAGAVLLFNHWREGRLRQAATVLAHGAAVSVLLLGALIASDRDGIGGDVLTSLQFRLSFFGVLGAIDVGDDFVIDPDGEAGDNRIEVWAEYWDRFLESPVRGIGLGTGWGEEGFQEPHNLWLQLLAETGLVGLAGFAVLLVSIGGSPGRLAGSVLTVLVLAALTQTVLFEPALWFGLGLWLVKVGSREGIGPRAAVT